MGWLTLFAVGTDLFVVSPLLPTIGRTFSVPEGEVGWMVTSFAIMYVIGGPLLGALADRVGRRRVLVTALVVFALANGCTALASQYWELLSARGLVGLAASGITPSVYGIVGGMAPRAKRAMWLSIVTSGLLLALSTGAPLGAIISSALSWRWVFACLALASAALAVGDAALMGEETNATHADTNERNGDSPTVRARVRAVSVTGLWALAVYGVYTFIGTGLRRSEHFGSGVVVLALVVYGVGAVSGNLGGGWLADRFGGRRVTAGALLALAAVEVGLGAAVGERVGALAGLLCLALVAYPYFSAQQKRLVDTYGRNAAALLAWNNTAMYAGILAASAVGGQILADAGFRVLIFVAAAAALVGALLTSRDMPSEEHEPIRRRPQGAVKMGGDKGT